MDKFRAFRVSAQFVEVTVVVFARSHSAAKAYALYTDWFEDSEYIELRARLTPGFEKLNTGERKIVDFCKNAELFYKNGWGCTGLEYCENEDCVMKGVMKNARNKI